MFFTYCRVTTIGYVQGPRHGGGRGGHGPPTLKNLGATGGAEGAIVLGGPGGAKTTGQGGP